MYCFFVLFGSFCTPMYASQLWCNFRTSCMQRLRVSYNFGCRVLYNLSWSANVSTHQVKCNIPTFEALLQKYTYLFIKRCRKSDNIWLHTLMQSDCLYLSLFFEHYNRILHCWWVIKICSIRLIDGASCHNAFAVHTIQTRGHQQFASTETMTTFIRASPTEPLQTSRSTKQQRWPGSPFQTPTPLLFQNFWIRDR